MFLIDSFMLYAVTNSCMELAPDNRLARVAMSLGSSIIYIFFHVGNGYIFLQKKWPVWGLGSYSFYLLTKFPGLRVETCRKRIEVYLCKQNIEWTMMYQ